MGISVTVFQFELERTNIENFKTARKSKHIYYILIYTVPDSTEPTEILIFFPPTFCKIVLTQNYF